MDYCLQVHQLRERAKNLPDDYLVVFAGKQSEHGGTGTCTCMGNALQMLMRLCLHILR